MNVVKDSAESREMMELVSTGKRRNGSKGSGLKFSPKF